jgi:uncharacterized membrane protein SpoIIM required for sporulation
VKTRDEFVAEREQRWTRLETLLDRRDSARDGEALRQVAALHRALCADVMQVRSLGFGPDLRWRLDALAARANTFLYRTPRREGVERLREMLAQFPCEIRRRGGFLLVASLLFWLPFGVGLLGALFVPEFSERVISAETLEQMNAAYSKGFAEGRASGQDAAMAGFYVQNNIGIAFRCFATGALFGAGSVFFLVYNGLSMGTVVGYLLSTGHGRNILTFVCGHTPFELGAIVISGGAGLMIGYALIDTGGLTRVAALRRAGRSALTLVVGAAVMLLLAALVEGFWSASSAADPVKWTVAALNTGLCVAYFAAAGRGARARTAS